MGIKYEQYDDDEAYNNFIQSLKTESTKASYETWFGDYMRFSNVSKASELITDEINSRLTEDHIKNYIYFCKMTEK